VREIAMPSMPLSIPCRSFALSIGQNENITLFIGICIIIILLPFGILQIFFYRVASGGDKQHLNGQL